MGVEFRNCVSWCVLLWIIVWLFAITHFMRESTGAITFLGSGGKRSADHSRENAAQKNPINFIFSEAFRLDSEWKTGMANGSEVVALLVSECPPGRRPR